MHSKQASTSRIDQHQAISNKLIAFNKSNSTNTIKGLNKVCGIVSTFKSEFSDESSSCQVVTDQYQYNSILSEQQQQQQAANKSLESLTSELFELEFESINEEEGNNQLTNRGSLSRDLDQKRQLAFKQGAISMLHQQSALEEENKDPTEEIIYSQENTNESELKMDTVRMNIQGAKTVEVIDASGLNSIETARSCGIAAKR